MKKEANNESESHYEEISNGKPEDTVVDINNTNLVDTSLDIGDTKNVDLVNTNGVSSTDQPLDTSANNLVDTSLDTTAGLVDSNPNSTSLVDTSEDTALNLVDTSVHLDKKQGQKSDTQIPKEINLQETCMKNDLVDSVGPDMNINVLSSNDTSSLAVDTDTDTLEKDTAANTELVDTLEDLVVDKSQGGELHQSKGASLVDTSPPLVDSSTFCVDISTTAPADMVDMQDMQETLVTADSANQPCEISKKGLIPDLVPETKGVENVKIEAEKEAASKVLEPPTTSSCREVVSAPPIISDFAALEDTSPTFVDTSPALADTSPPLMDTSPAFADTSPPLVDTSPAFEDTFPPIVDTSPGLVDTSNASPPGCSASDSGAKIAVEQEQQPGSQTDLVGETEKPSTDPDEDNASLI